ncbi:hypothetical protein MHYP_G00109390 [Metynnis hypsauchen]
MSYHTGALTCWKTWLGLLLLAVTAGCLEHTSQPQEPPSAASPSFASPFTEYMDPVLGYVESVVGTQVMKACSEEDISKLRRKIEKAKKPAENIRNGDEILNQEIIEYKARLTCPCCNSRMKDAVLTKCFHVFCFECVKTRYDTRQRKCPKCNAAFGANDFHRIYIG